MVALPPSVGLSSTFATRLSRNEAVARTTIAQRAQGLSLTVAGQPWLADLVPTLSSDSGAQAHYHIRMEWAGAAFVLCLSQPAVELLVDALLVGTSIVQLPPALAVATLEAALQPVLEGLQGLGQGTPIVLDYAQAPESALPRPAHRFDLLLRPQGAAALQGSIYCDGLGLLLLASLTRNRPIAAPSLPADTPLMLSALIGVTHITAAELRSLGRGDVVLMDACFVAGNRTLWLSADSHSGLQVQLSAADDSDSPQLTLCQPWSSIMLTDPTSPLPTGLQETAEEQSNTLPSADAIPVRISFDLGALTFTLAQLQQMQPGQTIDLARPFTGAVHIRANGALVGEGELVDIDGHIGVSLSRWFGSAVA